MSPSQLHITDEDKKAFAKALKGGVVNSGLILTKFDQKGYLNRRSAYKLTDWTMNGAETDDRASWPNVTAYTVPETPSFAEAAFTPIETHTFHIGRSIVYIIAAMGDDGYHGIHVLAYDTETAELFFVQWQPGHVMHDILKRG